MAPLLNIHPAFYPIGGAVLVFRVLHSLIFAFLPIPKTVDRRAYRHKYWTYRNTVLSFFHSAVTAVLSVCCYIDDPRMLSDMINTKTTLSYFLVVFSMGYFIHDLVDVTMNNFSNQMGLLLHHVVVCGAFGLALFGDIYFGFAVCALLMEISSIFLHSRKLLMFHGFAKKSLPFQVNGIFLLVTFIFFRFLTSAWMTNFVIQNRHQMPFSHFLQGTINMAILTVVNVVLLMTIYNSDFQNEKQINKQEQ